ncbi:hypothetical protein B0H13DRAFT_2313888 [Mycena leptocephala]|nr:hypothetical protein B0H13DRAFT_2313888 [Mycena leptocephala]
MDEGGSPPDANKPPAQTTPEDKEVSSTNTPPDITQANKPPAQTTEDKGVSSTNTPLDTTPTQTTPAETTPEPSIGTGQNKGVFSTNIPPDVNKPPEDEGVSSTNSPPDGDETTTSAQSSYPLQSSTSTGLNESPLPRFSMHGFAVRAWEMSPLAGLRFSSEYTVMSSDDFGKTYALRSRILSGKKSPLPRAHDACLQPRSECDARASRASSSTASTPLFLRHLGAASHTPRDYPPAPRTPKRG